ncbi:MAG: hypothetical protein ACT4P6_09355 [Gemmatimonadaceae bacterium]
MPNVSSQIAMRAEICVINEARGMVAALTEHGDYSIFECVSGDVAVGDEVSWSGASPLGHTEIAVVGRGRKVVVHFENHHVSHQMLRAQLLY